MKKNIFYIFIFLIFVLGFFTKIQKTEAAQPTINIEFRSADKKETGWLWVLTVETKNVQKGTPVWVYIYKNSIAGENLIKSEVAGNVDDTEIIQYNTGGILEDNTKHIISFMVKSSPIVHGYYTNTTGSTSPGQTQNINKEDDPEVVKPQEETDKWDGEYKLLAPLGKLETAPKNIGDYFNVIFNLAIGLCAVLAVVMIVIGGIQYMGDESIFGKTEAKSKIFSAILGLIIALGSYALLNTINPDLLGKNGVSIQTVSAGIEDFTVSGGASFSGGAVKINFNKEAYPAAKIASQKTGVDTAFILAMFAQETSSGSNTGKCDYKTANMANNQLEPLKEVAKRLNLNYEKINMSCSGGGSTHGGAIGYTQFLPGTWLEYTNEAKTLLGHEPNPWNTADALMMTALFLKNKGGAGTNETNQINAACKYFGSCNVVVSCGNNVSGTYGQCIIAKKKSIQDQINESIKKGEIN